MKRGFISVCGFILMLVSLTAGAQEQKTSAAEAAPNAPTGSLEIYFIDVGLSVGNATLLVTPSGQSVLLDAGPEYAWRRVAGTLQAAGVKQLDYIIITHFHSDHFGAARKISEQFPVRRFIDHGQSVELGKGDEWWRQRRGPWFKPGMGAKYDQAYRDYLNLSDKRRETVTPGDVIRLDGVEIRVACAGAKVLAQPLSGAGQPNNACDDTDRRADDDAEDGQSIGVLVTLGKFRFVYLGDLTWNVSKALFCPTNKVGTCDAYLITHHAQSLPKSLGEYYYGLCACPKAEVNALQPRVAVLSLGALGHKAGTSEAMQNVRGSPRLQDVWQTELITAGGEKDHNSGQELIATIKGGGGQNEPVRFIKLSAHPDGSFAMSNSRTGFTKNYPAPDSTH